MNTTTKHNKNRFQTICSNMFRLEIPTLNTKYRKSKLIELNRKSDREMLRSDFYKSTEELRKNFNDYGKK